MAKRTGKKKGIGIVALLLCGGALLAALNYYGTFIHSNIVSDPPDKGIVKIYRSYSYDDLCKAMTDSGVIDNKATFLRAARHMKLDEKFKPGRYRFRKGMGNKQIVRILSHGWQTPVNLSFSGYMRSMERFAGHLGNRLEADSVQFLQALTSPETLDKYGFTKATFPAMFIPNTYEVYWTVTPDEFIERMHKEYEKFWNEERSAKARSIGLSRTEVSTLASIVIEETKYEPEMARIAGVYMNRLHKGMLLQADPTVKFAVGDESLKRILNRHLSVDSPYNTYKYEGLPPGPITIPPVAAIDAVLNYEHHNYLYFCAKSTLDGQHAFSTNLAGHLENARRYHQAVSGI